MPDDKKKKDPVYIDGGKGKKSDSKDIDEIPDELPEEGSEYT